MSPERLIQMARAQNQFILELGEWDWEHELFSSSHRMDAIDNAVSHLKAAKAILAHEAGMRMAEQ